MDFLKVLNPKPKPDEQEKGPVFKQDKKYSFCLQDNPDHEDHSYCGKKDVIRPACKITLTLEELTSKDLKEIHLEISNLLERNGFILR